MIKTKNDWLYCPPSMEKWIKRMPLNDRIEFIMFKIPNAYEFNVYLFYEENYYTIDTKFEQGKKFYDFFEAQKYCNTHFKRIHRNMLKLKKGMM